MIRIVGVHCAEKPDKEFVLLQNQGMRRIPLRGHAVADDSLFAPEAGGLSQRFHAFSDDVNIPPSHFVALFTSPGQGRWGRTEDGRPVYFTYAGRSDCLWSHVELSKLHLMLTSTTYVVPQQVIIRTGAVM